MIQSPAGYQGDVRIKRYLDFYQAGYGVAMLSSGTTAFTPASLFAASEPGGWYDPSDLTTLYQDAAGTTPVTAVEQPVGLVLDKSRGLVLGPELVTNGDFSSSAGWVTGTGATISGGKLNLSAASGYVLYRNPVSGVQAGGYYEVTFTVSGYVSGSIRAYLGSTATFGTTVSANGTYTQRFGPTAGGEVGFNAPTAFTGSIDDLSVKAVSGAHLSQSTAAARPVLSARVNLLTRTEEFDNAAWTKTSVTVPTTQYTAPDGTATAELVYPASSGTLRYVGRDVLNLTNGVSYLQLVRIKSAGIGFAYVYNIQGNQSFYVNLSTGATSNVGTNIGNLTTSIDANGWVSVSFTSTLTTGTTGTIAVGPCDASGSTQVTANGTSGVYIWGADLRPANAGVGLPAYQRVGAATAGSSTAAGNADYDTTGFPLYIRADGTDDRLIGPAISNLISVSAYEACVGARVLAVSTSNANPWLNQSLLADGGGYFGVGYATTSNIIGAFNYDGTSDTATQPMTPPSTFVLQQRHDGGNLVLSLNGGSEASAASGNTTNLTFETRVFSSNSSPSVQAHLYGLVIRSTAFTATERANLRTWMNEKAKAF